jgi:hypothetical protein
LHRPLPVPAPLPLPSPSPLYPLDNIPKIHAPK